MGDVLEDTLLKNVRSVIAAESFVCGMPWEDTTLTVLETGDTQVSLSLTTHNNSFVCRAP